MARPVFTDFDVMAERSLEELLASSQAYKDIYYRVHYPLYREGYKQEDELDDSPEFVVKSMKLKRSWKFFEGEEEASAYRATLTYPLDIAKLSNEREQMVNEAAVMLQNICCLSYVINRTKKGMADLWATRVAQAEILMFLSKEFLDYEYQNNVSWIKIRRSIAGRKAAQTRKANAGQ